MVFSLGGVMKAERVKRVMDFPRLINGPGFPQRDGKRI